MTTPSARPIFIDTNILVYANIAAAPFHQQALAALQALTQTGAALWINRQVLREYAATITRQQTYAAPMSLQMAAVRLQYFIQNFQVADDTAAVSQRLLFLMDHVAFGGKQIHDANIVATMLAYNIPELMTHNIADFQRFAAYITLVPLQV